MAYNDSDNQNTREHMYGSQVISGSDKNISYKTADAFGTLTLEMAPLAFENEFENKTTDVFYDFENKQLILNSAHNKQLTIFSLEGKEIKSMNGSQLNTNLVNMENLPTGIYLIKTLDKNGTSSTLKIAIR
jgi:hypothetical protein